MPGDRLRVGVAGLGTMGRNHVRNLVARVDVVVVAVADPDAQALCAAIDHVPAARGYHDPIAMLDTERLDALVVATPTTTHQRLATAAIDRCIPVLVEKPLAATPDEAREVVRLAEARGTIVQVGHVERFNPAIRALRERLREGALSRIYSIKTTRAGPMPERIRDVGVASDLGTHDVDIICDLLDEWPLTIFAHATHHVRDHEDLVYALLTFPGEVVAHLDINWLSPEKERRIVVLGEQGMFRVDTLRQTLTFTRGAPQLAPIYLDGYAPLIVGDTVHLPVRPAEPLKEEIDAFVTAVRTGEPPMVGARVGLWAVVLAELLERSAAEGRLIKVPTS